MAFVVVAALAAQLVAVAYQGVAAYEQGEQLDRDEAEYRRHLDAVSRCESWCYGRDPRAMPLYRSPDACACALSDGGSAELPP